MKYTYKERIKEHGLSLFRKLKKTHDKWLEIPEKQVEKHYKQALCQIVEKISKKCVEFEFNKYSIFYNKYDINWKVSFRDQALYVNFGNNRIIEYVIDSTADQNNIVDEISRTLITLYEPME